MEYFHEISQIYFYHRLGTKFKICQTYDLKRYTGLLVTSYSEMSSRGYPRVHTPGLVLVSHYPQITPSEGSMDFHG